MLETATLCCYGCVAIAFFLGCYRLIIGPDTLNRLLAFDFITACIIGFIILYSIESISLDYLEVILIFSLLGFATIICFMEAFFYLKREKPNE